MTSTLFSLETEAMSRSESNIGKPDLGVTDKAKLKIFKTGIPILLTLTPLGSLLLLHVSKMYSNLLQLSRKLAWRLFAFHLFYSWVKLCSTPINTEVHPVHSAPSVEYGNLIY